MIIILLVDADDDAVMMTTIMPLGEGCRADEECACVGVLILLSRKSRPGDAAAIANRDVINIYAHGGGGALGVCRQMEARA